MRTIIIITNQVKSMQDLLCALKVRKILLVFLLITTNSGFSGALQAAETVKKRIAVVSSYHPEYIWSQQTNEGLVAGLLEYGYLDNQQQADSYSKNYQVESSRAIIKKYWMDSKRKKSRVEITLTLQTIASELDQFRPDIILLGDDNAANYIGNQYLDTDIPLVFWGVNGVPLKYGLLDSIEHPGHNITGVYQAGYHFEAVSYLQRLLPQIKTIAVLSDNSPTGRAHAKTIKRYADEASLPVSVKKVVITNSYSEWKKQALSLQSQVDAFFISTHNTLEDDKGEYVDYLEAADWYLKNIHKPSITPANFMVKEGFLSTVDDAGFNQGYEAMKIAHSILSTGLKPENISSYTPGRGPFIINSWRARMLGIDDQIKQRAELVDEFIEDHVAWKPQSQAK